MSISNQDKSLSVAATLPGVTDKGKRFQQLGVRMSPEEKLRVGKAAELDNRTPSDWSRLLLLDAADKKLPAPARSPSTWSAEAERMIRALQDLEDRGEVATADAILEVASAASRSAAFAELVRDLGHYSAHGVLAESEAPRGKGARRAAPRRAATSGKGRG